MNDKDKNISIGNTVGDGSIFSNTGNVDQSNHSTNNTNSGNTNTGNTGTISIGGSVSGGNVNMGGTQSFGDGATFTYSAGGANAESAALAELKQLYTELAAALQQIPAAQQEQLDAVQQIAQSALDEAQKEKPNKTLLTVTGDGLKQAAENLAGVAPIVGRIVQKLLLLG